MGFAGTDASRNVNVLKEIVMNIDTQAHDQQPMRSSSDKVDDNNQAHKRHASTATTAVKRDDVNTAHTGDESSGKTPDGAPMGEGSYEGTHGYADRIEHYMETADVEADAEAAQPHSQAEAAALRDAELEAKSRTKAEGK
jgi:hypothetical protein